MSDHAQILEQARQEGIRRIGLLKAQLNEQLQAQIKERIRGLEVLVDQLQREALERYELALKRVEEMRNVPEAAKEKFRASALAQHQTVQKFLDGKIADFKKGLPK